MGSETAAAWDREFVGYVNGLRAEHRLAPVSPDAKLEAAAEFRAGDMLEKNYFSHTTPGQGRPIDVAKRHGYEPDGDGTYEVGEIILWGDADPPDGDVSPRDAFLTWRESPDHYNVMVTPQMRAIGVGGPVGAAGKGPMWGVTAVLFGDEVQAAVGTAPAGARPAEGPAKRGKLPGEKPTIERREKRRARRQDRREKRDARKDGKDGPVDDGDGGGGAVAGGPGGATAAPALGVPIGPIRTPNTNGQPYGRDWSGITRWAEEIEAAAAAEGVPPERVGATVVVETGGTGDPGAVQPNESNGHSYGLMQVVPFGVGWEGWHRLVNEIGGPGDPVALLKVPTINLRVGCRILKIQHGNHGDWDKASSAFFLGNPDWRGWDTHNGNSGPAYRATLNGLIREWSAALPAPADAPAAPRPPALAADADAFRKAFLAKVRWVGTDNYHDRNGIAPVAIEHHVTDDMDYGNVAGWFKNRSSGASAHFVVERDGTIRQFVSTAKAAWTNGVYRNWRRDIPWLVDAIRRVEAEGRNLNDWTINVEFVGKPGQPFTREQVAAAIEIDRYCLLVYPTIAPVRGHMGRHADIDGVEREYCPGDSFPLAEVITGAGGDPTRLAA